MNIDEIQQAAQELLDNLQELTRQNQKQAIIYEGAGEGVKLLFSKLLEKEKENEEESAASSKPKRTSKTKSNEGIRAVKSKGTKSSK